MNDKRSFEGDRETKFFYSLSPEHILSAVEELGVRCTGRCLPLNSLENRVYEVEIEVDGEVASPSDRFRVVKFYRPGRWTPEQIREEHQFILDLREEDIPVVAPLVLSSGSTLSKLGDLDIWYAVFPKQRGRIPDEFDDGMLERMGRLLARMHNVGAGREAQHRLRLDPDSYGRQSLEFILEAGLLPDDLRKPYEEIVERICAAGDPLFAAAGSRRIHGDCHIGNILWGSDGPFLVDFDDMVRGPSVQDLWLIVPGRDEESRAQMDVMIDAYEEMRPFDRSTLKMIEILRALRFVRFSAWIGRRYGDPAFPSVFPDFGKYAYWREQLIDLHSQMRFIEEAL